VTLSTIQLDRVRVNVVCWCMKFLANLIRRMLLERELKRRGTPTTADFYASQHPSR